MFFTAWQKGLRKRMSSTSPGRPLTKARPKSYRPRMEVLEDRCVPSYAMVDLGALAPAAINKAGVVVGSLNGHAVEEQNGVITDLGTLGGPTSQAMDINDLGQVVGYSNTTAGPNHAFLYDGTMHDLGTLGGPSSRANGINNLGEVVGSADVSTATGTFHAFSWDSTSGMHDLGTFGGMRAWASAVNRSGQIVGSAFSGTSRYFTGIQAFLWSPSTGGTLLGQLPGDSASLANDINDAGQVVGTSGYVKYVGGFGNPYVFVPRGSLLWQSGAMTGLGFVNGQNALAPNALAINNNSQVVGANYLWQSGTAINLNKLIDPALGWTISTTADINAAGQIVGQGTLNGLTHYFLMSPTDVNQAVGFTVTGFPSPTTAGVAGSFTVTATNRSGTTAGGYTGTVQFASSDAQAVLPSAYTFTAADAGVHTFSATLKTAGTQSITVKDTVTATIVGSQAGISVTPAAASRLSITGPASVSAGAAFSITVTALDPYGNVATGYTGSVHFVSSDSSATLPADYTFTAADYGVPTFTGLILRQPGTQTVSVTDTLDSTLTDSLIVNVI